MAEHTTENVTEQVAFEQISPIVQVLDLEAAMDRYRRLGFEVTHYRGGERYAFVRRGLVLLHLNEWHEHDPKPGARVYIYVSDADALYAEWVAAGVEGRLGEPFDTQYGLREFAYLDPDGTRHRAGSPLSNPAT